MNLYKVLRHLVPEEIKALLEKIDTLDRYDSSSYPIEHLCRNGNFTRLERKLLSNAVARVRRRQTLSDAMHIVIYGTLEASSCTEPISGGLITSTGTFTYQNPVKVTKKVAPYGHP
jgi:hypothetical protein